MRVCVYVCVRVCVNVFTSTHFRNDNVYKTDGKLYLHHVHNTSDIFLAADYETLVGYPEKSQDRKGWVRGSSLILYKGQAS